MTSSGRSWSACMPKKCGIRRSPPVVDQPVSGIEGPPSGTPTLCAPTTLETPRCCPGAGWVIRKPTAAPASARRIPQRTAQADARSAMRARSSSTATTSVPAHRMTTVTAIALNRASSNGVAWLKWLRFPRTTCPVMITISTRLASATTVPAHQPTRRPPGSSDSIQARERQYATNETANLNGLAQIGAPTRTRSSTRTPTADTTARTAIAAENTTSGRCQDVRKDNTLPTPPL